MKKLVIIVGEARSGKSSTCEYLAKKYGYSNLPLSQLIRDFANRHELPLLTRKDYFEAFVQMKKVDGNDVLTNYIHRSSANKICADGIRQPNTHR